MYIRLLSIVLAVMFIYGSVSAQQQATVISRCGGTETVTIPSIADTDHDGMDDRLEQLLLSKFMPFIVQFANETCPGPALNGSGDSNLVVCHIYPVPQQYTRSSSYDSILMHPVALVPSRALVPGLIWYYPLVKVNCAILYGKDCGSLGHTADVEGFNFSLKYIGPDTLAGWMYDTTLSHWMGDTIQSISHAGTICEQIETRPMKSLYISWGADSIYCSPDKHGNYLTIGGCGSSFICNPGCGSARQLKHTRIVNLGEPNATMVADLGNVYPAYAGNDPWQTANFLDAQGGNAGAIRDKMLIPLTDDFIHGHPLTATQICPLYARCFGPFVHTYSDYTCAGTSYQFHTRSLTQSGTYRDTMQNANGCDSVITLSLSVLPLDSHSVQAYTCYGGSYSFDGQVLTASGTYIARHTDMHGCDSTAQLDLSVHPAVGSSLSAVSCDTPYAYRGHVLTASGAYIDTLTDQYGCDSIVTLSLTLDTAHVPTWATASDTVAPHSHAILLSAQPAGGTYTGSGVHGNVFYPDSVPQGVYIITYTYTDSSGCTRSAATVIAVLIAGISEEDMAAGITLYPNPATDMLYAESGYFTAGEAEVSVCDMTGKAIPLPITRHDAQIGIHTTALAAGVYSVRFTVGGQSVAMRFVRSGW